MLTQGMGSGNDAEALAGVRRQQCGVDFQYAGFRDLWQELAIRTGPGIQEEQADDFAARVEQWAARIAGIDGRISLNPCAGASGGKLADGTDISFRDAEEHGVTGISDH
jgi:hypothetical protein